MTLVPNFQDIYSGCCTVAAQSCRLSHALALDGCRPSGACGRLARYLLAHGEDDLGAGQLDGAHHLVVWHRTNADLSRSRSCKGNSYPR